MLHDKKKSEQGPGDEAWCRDMEECCSLAPLSINTGLPTGAELAPPQWAGPPTQVIIRKGSIDLPVGQSNKSIFLSRGSLFPNDSTLCQVDKKPMSTVCICCLSSFSIALKKNHDQGQDSL